MRDATTETQGHKGSVAVSDVTKSTAGEKATRKRQRKKATYKHEVKRIIERLLTMELILLTCMEEVADVGQEEEWSDAE